MTTADCFGWGFLGGLTMSLLFLFWWAIFMVGRNL